MPRNESRVEDERHSAVIEKRGAANASLIGMHDHVRLAASLPEVLRVIGEESQRKGTDKLTSRQIDGVIKAARARKSERHDPLRLTSGSASRRSA